LFAEADVLGRGIAKRSSLQLLGRKAIIEIEGEPKSGRKFERSDAENGAKNGGKSPPEIAENQTASQVANEANGGKVPAFKSRGEL
jgi:hypothetical protein